MLPPHLASGLGSGLLPVAGLGWNDVADAAAGVRNVPGVTWNDVEMELQNGLAGGRAIVDSKVEAVGSWRQA